MAITVQVRRIMDEMNRFSSVRMARLAAVVLNILRGPPEDGGTPIKTGFASSNWLVGIGQPVGRTVGSKASVTRGPQLAGLNSLIRYKITSGPIFISNNSEYIAKLNAGSSGQAPANFVQKAFAVGVATANRGIN